MRVATFAWTARILYRTHGIMCQIQHFWGQLNDSLLRTRYTCHRAIGTRQSLPVALNLIFYQPLWWPSVVIRNFEKFRKNVRFRFDFFYFVSFWSHLVLISCSSQFIIFHFIFISRRCQFDLIWFSSHFIFKRFHFISFPYMSICHFELWQIDPAVLGI